MTNVTIQHTFAPVFKDYGVSKVVLFGSMRKVALMSKAGHILQLGKTEWQNLKSQFLISSWGARGELITNCDNSKRGGGKEVVKNFDHLDSRSKFLTLKKSEQGHYQKYPPKTLTEKGLCMLVTVLMGKREER